MFNTSYWEHNEICGNIDFLIVGSGLTGMQTAIEIKERELNARVVVVDRAPWSQGASTKNAGFACFANMGELLDDLIHDSEENVFQTVQRRYMGLEKLKGKFGLDAIGYEAVGGIEEFNHGNKQDLHKCLDSLQSINHMLSDLLNLDRVFTFTSNSSVIGGVGSILNPFEGKLNTGKLYRSIQRYAQSIGVEFMGGLSLTNWERTSEIKVNYEEGIAMTTKNLVLCTNAFTSKFLNEDILPARGQILLTEPVPGLVKSEVHMYDKGYYYWRVVDDRVLLGGARNKDKIGEQKYEFGSNYTVIEDLKAFLEHSIIGKAVRIDYQWSGIMAMGSQSKAPLIKKLDKQVYLAARLGGMGVALSSLVAQDMAELIFS